MAENVFLFVPNVIGYIRIMLAFVSFYYMTTEYGKAVLYYMISGLLDAVDGYAARYLNQGSRFGAMLDMLTDRCALLCLLMALGCFYPNYILLFQLSATIDIASHWLHMRSGDIKGVKSHKSTSETTNPILKLYYTSRPFLFFMCAGNEAFYALLYLCHFTCGPIIPLINFGILQVLGLLCLPVAVLKTAISLVHLAAASQTVAELDVQERACFKRTDKLE